MKKNTINIMGKKKVNQVIGEKAAFIAGDIVKQKFTNFEVLLLRRSPWGWDVRIKVPFTWGLFGRKSGFKLVEDTLCEGELYK